MRPFVLSLIVCIVGIAHAKLGASECTPSNCSICGCCPATCKVCRPVEEKGKKSKTVFSCECEDFCIPGKSTFCGYKAECGDCGETKCVKVWKPGCAEVRTRKVLKKSTEDEEVTEYKWEVVEVCAACARHGCCRSSACGGCGVCRDGDACEGCAQTSKGESPLVAQSSATAGETAVPSEPDAALAPVPTKAKTVSLVKRLIRSQSK